MSNLVDLGNHRPHEAGPVVCVRCSHEWVAVRPAGTGLLECPKCGAERGASLAAMLSQPEAFIGDECCGQLDASGICAAPACIRGDLLKLIGAMRVVYASEHPE